MIEYLKRQNIPLPPKENRDSLTAKDIMRKIDGFYERFSVDDGGEDGDFAEGYFLRLLAEYPVSMCSRDMSDALKLIAALAFFESKPKPDEKDPSWNGYTYEYLGLVFDRSKSTIHAAINQKEAEAKRILADSVLRKEAKDIALQQLVEEEKAKLKEKSEKDGQTNEQTP